jgi:hypothetical protein
MVERMRREGVVLFAGPTAHGLDTGAWTARGDRVLPPARRGDIDRLRESHDATPGVLVLCDGTFDGSPAVSHSELCRALDAGWEIWGVSSMGAIRAHELREHGMQGFGYVYRQFARRADFTDDEMALLYFPEPPYFPASEPLVNLRHTLERHARPLGLPPGAVRRLLRAMQALWFGNRTLTRIRAAALEDADFTEAQADALLSELVNRRVKNLDLAHLMRLRPWATPGRAVARRGVR